MADPAGDKLNQKAGSYSRLKYRLSLISTIYQITILAVILALGWSKEISLKVLAWTSGNYLTLPAYLFILFIFYYLLSLPLDFYYSFLLEHRFSLSKQKISHWLIDQVKAGVLTYIIGLICFSAFYYILKVALGYWWLVVWLFWIFFTLALANLLPVLIIPLFFKYKKMNEEALRLRVMNLAEKMKIKILDVFEIDLSKKTLKGNAAFVGMGATRRVLLADTLKEKYTYEEIDAILAHEFAHYRLKHMLKLVILNSFVTMGIFYVIFKTSPYTLGIFGLSTLADVSALPVIFLYFIIFGFIFEPAANLISRRFEREADRLALETTGLPKAFISTMEKLASQNLADRNPGMLVKIFFFDHPPIDERINMAKCFSRDKA
jgi:STE24 endopeptidase